MAEYGIEDSGDIAGVAGVGTGGNAQPLQSFPAGTAFPMGVLGVGGHGAGYGVCGLGFSPTPLPALAAPNDAVGVYGQGGAGNSIGVVGVGTGSSPGVVGTGGGANGTGVAGHGGLPTGIGVWGSGASHGETAQPPAGSKPTRFATDSPLEGAGFEPSVPGASGFGFAREGPNVRIPAPSNGESVSRNSGKFKGRPRGGGVLRRGSGPVLALMMMRGEEREVDCFADLGTAQGEQTTPGKFTAATD